MSNFTDLIDHIQCLKLFNLLLSVCIQPIDSYMDVNLLFSEHTATVKHCAHELRKVGDALDWRYKLLEILTKNYKNVIKVK